MLPRHTCSVVKNVYRKSTPINEILLNLLVGRLTYASYVQPHSIGPFYGRFVTHIPLP